MKLFLLERTANYIGFDETRSQVVIAKNETDAREFANNCSSDEGWIWDNPKLVKCTEIKLTKKNEGSLLQDVNQG